MSDTPATPTPTPAPTPTPKSVAEVFFGGAAPTAPTSKPSSPPADAPTLKRPDAPGESAEPPRSEEDAADVFFGDPATIEKSYRPVLADTLNAFRDRTGASQSEFDTAMREASVIFHDARMPPEEASRVYSTVLRYTAEPADEAQQQAWATESRRQLRERYGPEEATRRLAAVKQFIDNRPGMAELLEESGAGSHPDVVLAFVERASNLRVTPRKQK